MGTFVKSINYADALYREFHNGMITFLELMEKLCDIGCYNITQNHYSYDGIRLKVVR